MWSLYRDFKIVFKGETYFRPFWMNDTNPTYVPQIYYEDINKDEKKELIIILKKGDGTGVLDEEVYVYRYTNGLIDELGALSIPLDHPELQYYMTDTYIPKREKICGVYGIYKKSILALLQGKVENVQGIDFVLKKKKDVVLSLAAVENVKRRGFL